MVTFYRGAVSSVDSATGVALAVNVLRGFPGTEVMGSTVKLQRDQVPPDVWERVRPGAIVTSSRLDVGSPGTSERPLFAGDIFVTPRQQERRRTESPSGF